MKTLKKCPVVLLILATSLLFQGIGVRGAQGIYRDVVSSAGFEPGFAPVFREAHEGIYPWSGPGFLATAAQCGDRNQEVPDEADVRIYANTAFPGLANDMRADAGQRDSAGGVSANAVSANSVSGNVFFRGKTFEHTVSDNTALAETKTVPETSALSGLPGSVDTDAADLTSAFSETPASAETPVPPVPPSETQPPETDADAVMLQPVGEDYFDDALFIGDSRTVGLFEYGKMGEHACCYAKTSMTVYDIFEKEKPIVDPGDGREAITVEQALTENQFGKIYIMIGLNEMGTGTAESFVRSYAAVVERIRELQPQALIYIQGIMRVAAEKNATDPVFNNANIDLRNEMLAGLADRKNIFYLDVNEVVCDEDGCLFSDWTFDQIHLKAAYYKVWKEYLLNHGVIR